MATDVRQVHGRHWLRPFIEYAVEKGVLSRDVVNDLLRLRSEIDTRIGQLAALKGYITPKDVFYVVVSQVEENRPFGQIAIDRKLLSERQVRELLEMQQDPLRTFVELIRVSRAIDEADLRGLMKDFLESSRIVLEPEDALPPAPAKPAPRIENLRGVFRRVREAAVVPETLQRLLQLLDSPDSKIEEVVGVIQGDPVVTAQVLRLVNSAFFGLQNKISSVRHGVITVGFRGIRQIVLFVKVLEVFDRAGREKLRDVWRHSILASQWAQALVRLHGSGDAEEALVGGLVHDLGRPAIRLHFPESMREIELFVQAGMELGEAERRVLGCTHADVGAYLCHLWKFPGELHEAVLYHHASVPFLRNVKDLPPLVHVVNAACALSCGMGEAETEEHLAGLPTEFLEFYGLDRRALAAQAPAVLEGARELVQLIV
jgi:putative nucleotidyltransferase with HDIG domain